MKERMVYVWIGAGLVGLTAVYLFGARLFSAISDVNKGTAFEGTGAVGTLGNVTNQLLGGLPQAAGERISRWFEPDYDVSKDVQYAVIFPDNSRHAVPSGNVDESGFFTLNGVRYRMGLNQGGYKVAVRA